MKKIQVLMSTYNGVAYLREQLNTILAQDCGQKEIADFSLLVRDDGSTDGTQDILREYERMYPDRIAWYQGENVGVIKSFFELLAQADEEADYVAFSDQDDVWMPEKLSRAVSCIDKMEREHPDGTFHPVLYCCRPMLVNEELQEIKSEIERPPVRVGFGNALIENVVTGCTAVLNRRLRELLCEEFPEYVMMHDRWFYLVASYFGEVYFDETSLIRYRQHAGNAVGMKSGKFAEICYRAKNFSARRNAASRQAREFERIFQNRSGEQPQKWQLLQKFLAGKKSFRIRRELANLPDLYRQRDSDKKLARWLLLLNLY